MEEDFVDFKQRFEEIEFDSESSEGDFLDELIERGIEYISCEDEPNVVVVDKIQALYNEIERLQDENTILANRNWDLNQECRNYKMELRIATRPMSVRVLDLSCFLKETITEVFRMAVDYGKLWRGWVRHIPRIDDVWYFGSLSTYRWWLEGRYYYRPHEE